jgi:hypothetical protein
MIYTHALQQDGQGVPSPLDDLDIWMGRFGTDSRRHSLNLIGISDI